MASICPVTAHDADEGLGSRLSAWTHPQVALSRHSGCPYIACTIRRPALLATWASEGGPAAARDLASIMVWCMQLNGQTYPAVVSPGTGGTLPHSRPLSRRLPSHRPWRARPTLSWSTTPPTAPPLPRLCHPYSFNLPVGPATTTVTQTVTPTSPVQSAPTSTVAGTIASSNGAAPARHP